MTTETRYNLTGDGVAMGALLRGENGLWRWAPDGAEVECGPVARTTAGGLFGSLVCRLGGNFPQRIDVSGGDGRAVGTIERNGLYPGGFGGRGGWLVTVRRPSVVHAMQHTSPSDAFEWMVRMARHRGVGGC